MVNYIIAFVLVKLALACDPKNLDWHCCEPDKKCRNGEGDCDVDSDCLSGFCAQNVGSLYGSPRSDFDVCAPRCDPSKKDWSCCTAANKCINGHGDCDVDADCASGHCAHNVGGIYGVDDPTFDVCGPKFAPQNMYETQVAPPDCPLSKNDFWCCDWNKKCKNGHGGCNSDYDCLSHKCVDHVCEDNRDLINYSKLNGDGRRAEDEQPGSAPHPKKVTTKFAERLAA